MKTEYIGASIGACGRISGCEQTPYALPLPFHTILDYRNSGHDLFALKEYFTALSQCVYKACTHNRPIVVGGDHACAIGTWSGVLQYLTQNKQDLHLIWVDAHMDANTPQTSPTGNIHGMPLATLMGYGHPDLTSCVSSFLKPENLTLIGIRSFESGEAELLHKHGVKIYFMDEIQQRGIDMVLKEAYQRFASKGPVGFSIDMDAFDPQYAPGVGTPEAHGIDFPEFLKTFAQLDPASIIALEITEFNPTLDHEHKTAQNLLELANIWPMSTSITSPSKRCD